MPLSLTSNSWLNATWRVLLFVMLAVVLSGAGIGSGAGAQVSATTGVDSAAVDRASDIRETRVVREMVSAQAGSLFIAPERLAAAVIPARPAQPTMQAQFIARPTPPPAVIAQPAAPAAAPAGYSGVQRLWVPALGINTSWGHYGCGAGSQNSLPNGAFVWTCSGANNTYMVSHNTSTFNPIWAAYRNGTLRPGMTAVFADAAGNISHWRLAYAVDMESTTEVYERWSEAGGDSATPVLTMQTCLDTAASRFIIVRWVPAG